MAVDDRVFSSDSKQLIHSSKVLVVGAGGIGCELLKNLVLSGFRDIEIIDLDTIDVSNLNRQFLFRKEHVGKSKAQVAKESVLKFVPSAKIIAHHDSVIQAKYGVSFIKGFDVVLNALDNRAARNQVNRVCLAAGVPLVESGTAGYLGQVELICKGVTQCYECDPKVPPRTYPGCTIRNTPSEFVHTVVWSKHLFNQLFGTSDEDDDVSPDTSDPNAVGPDGDHKVKEDGNMERVSTRKWAQSVGFDAGKVFTKLFTDDIKYLLSMDNLWKSRQAPVPLEWERAVTQDDGSSKESNKNRDEKLWSIAECCKVFADCMDMLSKQYTESGDLTWDKDDKASMEFVAACANIRSHIFNIKRKSLFEAKSIAGNIIPAIATSNAIIAGLVVLQTIKVLQKKIERCQSVYLRKMVDFRGQLIVPEKVHTKPNPNCAVCSPMPQVTLCADVNTMTVREFESLVLKQHLNLPAPDVVSKTGVILSSEEGETEHNLSKTLKEVGVEDGSILSVDDFIQNYELKIIICQKDKPSDPEEPIFTVVGKLDTVASTSKQTNGEVKEDMDVDHDSEDDVEEIFFELNDSALKRRHEDEFVKPVKKRKPIEEDDDCAIID